ncbi:MAG: histidine kinase, partial [Chloroflexota bacterium]
NYKIDFGFPFYGQFYDQVYIASSGAIAMGEPFWLPNMQMNAAHLPAIFPLLIELEPNPPGGTGGGLYARVDADRLVVTWNRLPALYQPESIFTFQAVLYANGIFDISYKDLPLPFIFDPDATPSANPWMRGIVPGRGELLHVNADDLLLTAQSGASPLIENYQLAFRRYLHEFMLPLGQVVIGGGLLLMIGLPLLLRFSIVKPLEALTDGVQQMESGDLTVMLPIQNEDEIGYLTGAFNSMAARLVELVAGLEERVAERTADLHAEMRALEAAQAEILKQGRELAALEERTRLSRELHDGLGQVLGYINVQTEAMKILLEKGQVPAAQTNLEQLAQASREAQVDLREHLLGLRAQDMGAQDMGIQSEGGAFPIPARPTTLFEVLPVYLEQFQARHGVEVRLWPPKTLTGPLFPPNVEEQALRIIQEALTNVSKHAQARRVDVEFQVFADQVQITIMDDGVGFEIEDWRLEVGGWRFTNRALQFPVPRLPSPVTSVYPSCASVPRGSEGGWKFNPRRVKARASS